MGKRSAEEGGTDSRLPPHHRAAERAVLGAMIRNNECIGDLHAMLKQEDFYVIGHQLIYAAALALSTGGRPVDLVTLTDHFRGNPEGLTQAGGIDYLVGLWDAAPSASQSAHYAKIVRGQAMLRDLLRVAEHIQQNAHAGHQHAAEIVAEIEQRIFAISTDQREVQSVPLPRILDDAAQAVDEQSRRRVTGGIGTGLLDLDRFGGLHDGAFVIFAARPGVGKTAMLLSLFLTCADNDVPSVFFSLEQSRQELAERIFCMRGGIDSKRLRSRHVSAEDGAKIMEVVDLFSHSANLFVCDTPCMTMQRIISEVRRLKIKHGLRAAFVDYLQLIEPENRKVRREEQVAAISRRLKLLAREVEIPVIAAAQLNRNAANQRPGLSDLRESGSQEQDTDAVYLLHDPAHDHPSPDGNSVIEVIIAKNRNGPKGQCEVFYRGSNMRFENHAPGVMP